MIRADFSMGDLEAALTLRYVARDAELIAASANEEGNGGIVDPVEELANAQAKKEEARRKNGVVRTLQKGRCENCGMDEVRLRVEPLSRGVSTEPRGGLREQNGAIMWRSDKMFEQDFGLRRRLCNRCGLYVRSLRPTWSQNPPSP
jgi:hypothetical protein